MGRFKTFKKKLLIIFGGIFLFFVVMFILFECDNRKNVKACTSLVEQDSTLEKPLSCLYDAFAEIQPLEDIRELAYENFNSENKDDIKKIIDDYFDRKEIAEAEKLEELRKAEEAEKLEEAERAQKAEEAESEKIADWKVVFEAFENKDYATAYEKFLPLAEEGNAQAQYYLGEMYFYGRGVEKNEKEAMKWYELSAEQGNYRVALRLYAIGEMYETGTGVKQDYAEAIKWYKRAFKNGDGPSGVILGVIYAEGRYVKKDLPRALMWYIVSDAVKSVLDDIKKEMTPQQIEQAEQLAKACKESNYTEC